VDAALAGYPNTASKERCGAAKNASPPAKKAIERVA
jgi:hypothetical protein